MTAPPLDNTAFDEPGLLQQLRKTIAEAGGFNLARGQVLKSLKKARHNVEAHSLQVLTDTADGLLCGQSLSVGQDQIVRIICQLVAEDTDRGWPKQLNLCATGGYGRAELAPGSDLDLLFLTENKAAICPQIIEKILYLLWDCGLRIGHAVRSHKQALILAKQDHTIATAMMDLRTLFGQPALSLKLSNGLLRLNSSKRNRQFVSDKLLERDQRHQRTGPTRYLVEPNVKEGKGGLRDLQSLLWIAQRLDAGSEVSGSNHLAFFTRSEYRRFVKINRFLWTVRCWLHFVSGRAEDRLTFDLQPELARKLRYRDSATKPAVERLMKAYFLNAKEVGFLTRVFCAKLEERAAKPAPFAFDAMFPKKSTKNQLPGFKLVNGRLDFAGKRPSARQSANLIELFLQADRAGIHIHPDALAHVRRVVVGLDAAARSHQQTRSKLLSCLTETSLPEQLLRLMSETGLLGKLVPEFGRIIGQTQFNMYHSYTVDEHTLRAVGVLHKLETGQIELAGLDMSAILAKTANRQALYLAMLLHDTGKGLGDQEHQGAIATRSACVRLGLSLAQTELAGWLVENHLLFSDTGQGRDLGDPETISAFANKVGSLERLRLLFALTVADIHAVGPGVWTGWKGQLLGTLYQQTERFFLGRSQSNIADDPVISAQNNLKKALKDDNFWKKWITEFNHNYWLSFSGDQLLSHAKLVGFASKKQQNTTWQLLAGSENQLTLMMVWSDDQPGLFAALCAIATANGAAIASARVFTTQSGKAFDVFDLHDGRGGAFAANNSRALDRVRTMLGNYFENRALPVPSQRKPTRREAAFSVMSEVVIDNETSARATVIECVGADVHGLLRDLSQTLNQCRVNIHSAHITTYGERAVDIFYVNEKTGSKVRNARRISHIRKKLLAVLEQSPADADAVQQAPASRYR